MVVWQRDDDDDDSVGGLVVVKWWCDQLWVVERGRTMEKKDGLMAKNERKRMRKGLTKRMK